MERNPSPAAAADDDAWWHQLDPRRSLPVRASLLAGGGVLTFTLLLAWIAGAVFRAQLTERAGASLATLAFQVSDKLDRSVYERFRELQVVTALAPMRDAEAPPAGRRAVLEAFQSACPDYAWIGFADAGGTVIAAASGALEGTKVGDRDWFKGARSAPYAGEMQAAPAGGRAAAEADGEPPLFINLAAPVPAPNGRFLGVLGASLHWSWAREVQTSVVPDSARRERLGVTIYADNGERLLDSGGSGWSEPPGVPKIPFRQRSRGFIWEDAEGGTTYLAGYARSHGFREYPGLNVLVVVRQPARVVLAPVRELQSWIWWLGVALAAGAVLASWLFAARLVGALQAVTSAAGRIRGGDVTSLMPRHHGFDEAAQMTGALGAMVDAFRRKQDELEANNAQLEKRLRERRDPPPPPGGI